jgi:hypothetical protein
MSERAHPDNYFTAFEQCYANNRDGTRLSYGPLEKALERMDNEAWKRLADRSLPLITKKDPRRKWDQLFNSLYEAFGYKFLADRGYTSIQFIDRGDDRTPDLLGKSETSTAILEVKTISNSDKEIDRLAARPLKMFNLAQELSDELKKKLRTDIENARGQLEAFDMPVDRRIVLLVVHMDCDHWGNDKIEKLNQFAQLQQTADLEVVVRPLVVF